jgi:DNA-binding NtrC family response regulator
MRRDVFVVEEDIDCRTALGEVLQDMGLSPILFDDPHEALGELDRIAPALIVTELGKPGTPAAAPFHALLAGATRAELPAIVFSGWNRTAVEPHLPFPFIAKPEIWVLLEMIRGLVRQPAREAGTSDPARAEAVSDAA